MEAVDEGGCGAGGVEGSSATFCATFTTGDVGGGLEIVRYDTAIDSEETESQLFSGKKTKKKTRIITGKCYH